MKKRLTENVQKQLLKMAANNTEHKKNGTQTSLFKRKKGEVKNERKNRNTNFSSSLFFVKHTSVGCFSFWRTPSGYFSWRQSAPRPAFGRDLKRRKSPSFGSFVLESLEKETLFLFFKSLVNGKNGHFLKNSELSEI